MFAVAIVSLLPFLLAPLDRAVVFAVPPSGTGATDDTRRRHLRSSSSGPGPCDESFPHVQGIFPERRNGASRRLVAIPPAEASSSRLDDSNPEYYETGEYYAPLCPDGRSIDIRELRRCNAGSCWNEEYNQCTFECVWNFITPTPKPSPMPTEKPTFLMVVTDHPLLVSLNALAETYRMDRALRDAIVKFIKERLAAELEELDYYGLELIDLDYAGRLPGRPNDLPLNITVKGASDVSDFAHESLKQTLQKLSQEIVNSLKSMDDEAMKHVSVSIDTYDFKDTLLTEETAFPMSASPTPSEPIPVEVKPMDSGVVAALDGTVTKRVPWWVWLIVVMIVLLCFVCCVCACIRRRRRNETSHTDEKGFGGLDQQVNLFMQNRMGRRRPPPPTLRHHPYGARSHRSVADSRRTSRTKHRAPHRSVATAHPSDQRRRTSRTRHTHRTRSSRPPSASSVRPPAPMVVVRERAHLDIETAVSEADYRNYNDQKTQPSIFPALPPPLDHAETSSVISDLESGYDPPEENAAIVLYQPPDRQAARDDTFYTDRTINPDQTEPEGEKVCRKQSMFGDVALMNQVRREREEESQRRRLAAEQAAARAKRGKKIRGDESKDSLLRSDLDLSEKSGIERSTYYHSSDPEGLTSDELDENRKRDRARRRRRKKTPRCMTKRKACAASNSRVSAEEEEELSWEPRKLPVHIDPVDEEEESSDSDSPSYATKPPPPARTTPVVMKKKSAVSDFRLRPEKNVEESLRSREEKELSIESEPLAEEEEESYSDSPSILTNPPPDTEDEGERSTGHDTDNHGSHKRNHSGQPRKRIGQKVQGLFSSIKRRSSNFVKDGVSSDDESFHIESDDDGNK